MLILSERPLRFSVLHARMERLGLVEDDPAALERALERLEDLGAVAGSDGPQPAPEDRCYGLTSAGAGQLGLDVDDLNGTRTMVERFLARYSERLGA